jgi:putative Mn2+ efflux pump MntP
MLDIILIALGLSMDAFAVSISMGLNQGNNKHKFLLGFEAGTVFGGYQAIMPLLCIFLFSIIGKYVAFLKGYLAFVVLLIIGFKMIVEAFKKDDCEIKKSINLIYLLILGFATSIDAFFIGVSLVRFDFNIYFAVIIIGIITFLFSFFGVILGRKIGCKFEKRAEIFGGVILILLAFKMFFME